MKILRNSNFVVHKVLRDTVTSIRLHSISNGYRKGRGRMETVFTSCPFTACWPLIQKMDERRKTYARASGTEQTSWKMTQGWTRVSGKQDGVSRAVSGHRVSNQQGARMRSNVVSWTISGFSFEELGVGGGVSPSEWVRRRRTDG